MTEAEWLTTSDPNRLLARHRSMDGRRLRLLSAAVADRVRHLLTAHVCHLAAEMAFRKADEDVPADVSEDLRRATWEYIRANAGTRPQPAVNADSSAAKSIHPFPDQAAQTALWDAIKAFARDHDTDWRNWEQSVEWAKSQFISIVRDLFGNPFRPVEFDAPWRTDTAVSLARQMYDSRAFSIMPILADALQDAGCEHADILAHCRGDRPHVRGCWVVDLVLGKG